MRSRCAVAGALLLVACASRTDRATTATATAPDGGSHSEADATAPRSDAGANEPSAAADVWIPNPPATSTDAGSPVCTVALDGWAEQKISFGAVNRGFYQTLAGDDARIAALGSAPTAASAYAAGAVYLYERAGSGWQAAGVLSVSNPDEGFGNSIAIDGNFVAVGAPSADAGQGAVYVYATEGGATKLEQRIPYPHAPNIQAGFGVSVALRGTSLMIGAYTDSISAPYAGRIYAYEHVGSTWTLSSEIVSDDIASNDEFGAKLSFDGERLAVLSPGIRPEGQLVYVFAKGSSGWTEEARLVPQWSAPVPAGPVTPSPETLVDIALDGDALLASTSQGRVLAFGRSSGAWTFDGELPLSGSEPQATVALLGSVAAVGRREHVDLFDKTGGGWQLRETLRATGEPRDRSFGSAVALGTDSVAVLAPGDDEWGAYSGAIYGYVADPTAHYASQCVEQSTTAGTGTACTRSGVTSAICSHLGPGSGALQGSTPLGPLDLGNAWLDVIRGDMYRLTLTFGGSAPRRADALPSVSIAIDVGGADPLAPGGVKADAVVTLCDGIFTVPATVVLTSMGRYSETPLVGTVSIAAPGWDVTGSFTLDGECQSSSSH